MKDELGRTNMAEIVAIRSKTYSCLMDSGNSNTLVCQINGRGVLIIRGARKISKNQIAGGGGEVLISWGVEK